MKIVYQSTLDFARFPKYAAALNAHIRKVASTDTEIIVQGRSAQPDWDLDPAEFASPIMYRAVVESAFVQSLMAAEDAGADAFIVASFSEPILPELRSLARIPVVSISEASFMAAALNASKVGLVTLYELVVPLIEKSAALHKWSGRMTGIYVIEGDVSEAQLEANFDRPGPYLDMLEAGARIAIASGAQIVIPAEGMLAAVAAVNDFRDVDGVPVVDAIGAAVLFAELAVSLKERTGLAHSRVTYRPPSDEGRRLLNAARSA